MGWIALPGQPPVIGQPVLVTMIRTENDQEVRKVVIASRILSGWTYRDGAPVMDWTYLNSATIEDWAVIAWQPLPAPFGAETKKRGFISRLMRSQAQT